MPGMQPARERGREWGSEPISAQVHSVSRQRCLDSRQQLLLLAWSVFILSSSNASAIALRERTLWHNSKESRLAPPKVNSSEASGERGASLRLAPHSSHWPHSWSHWPHSLATLKSLESPELFGRAQPQRFQFEWKRVRRHIRTHTETDKRTEGVYFRGLSREEVEQRSSFQWAPSNTFEALSN